MADFDLLLRAATVALSFSAALAVALRRHRGVNRGQTPVMAIKAHPEWKDLWYDEPTRQYGRAMRYYQQLQALDVEGAWREVAVPTLVIHRS